MSADERPVVSIIIPFHNRADLTQPCLESIAEHTRDVACELLLVDDASTEPAELERWAGGLPLRVLRNEQRRTYSQNNNRAAAEARGEFLCLLNNDTVVSAGWLANLVAVARAQPDLGVLGNQHLFPGSGLLHHAGMAFDDQGYPLHIHPGTDPAAPAVSYPRDVPAVTFACVLIPADFFRQLGGLDEGYRNGFEDCDFCLRARAAGRRVHYTPASVIQHHGQATANRKDHDDANWTRFREAWAARVEKTLEALTTADREYNESIRRRPRLVRPRAPGLHLQLNLDEASAFTWAGVDLAVALDRRGETVSVPYTPILHRSIPAAKARVLRRLMRRAPGGDFHVKWSHYWPQYLHVPMTGDVNAEFFCTNYRYRAEGRWLDLWLRHVQVNDYRKIPVSGFNLEALREIGIPAAECAVMPLGYSPEVEALDGELEQLRRSDRPELNILLVTNSHDLQRYGTDLAVAALAQAFGPQDPVVVHIKDYGAGPPTLRNLVAAQPRFPRVVWHEQFLSKEDLLRLYASMDVQLAPFRGEGFAMKILDGMAVGLPALFPAFGGPLDFAAPGAYLPLPHDEVPVGACLDRDTFYLGEGAYWCQARVPEMAALLAGLPGRRAELGLMGQAARALVRSRFSWDASARQLMNALRGWGAVRRAAVSARRAPSERALSVIIPTQNREPILEKTLEGYARQSLPAGEFEVVVVNDHGRPAELAALLDRYRSRLTLRLLENHGTIGPGTARNLALEQVRGEIVLITGDDIIPDPDFLREHVAAHRRQPELETAYVGLTLWHPEIVETNFMRYITGKGGHQFSYDGLKDGQIAGFERFYTSNCSFKRLFAAEEERLFSTRYRYAAFEDIEFAYRLHLRGMQVRFAQQARGFHLHPMTPATFVERQRKVGRMLTVLCLQRPALVPPSHTTFLRALEFQRSWEKRDSAADVLAAVRPDEVVADLAHDYTALLELGDRLTEAVSRPVVNADRGAWCEWAGVAGHRVWEQLNELNLRAGMAEEWCVRPEEVEAAKAWSYLMALPKAVGLPNDNKLMPFSVPGWCQALFPNSRVVFFLSQTLRRLPVLGQFVHRAEASRVGRWARAWATRLVRGKG